MITRKLKFKTTIQIQRDISELKKALDKLCAAVIMLNNILDQKYNKRLKFNLELIVENAVDRFYESYTPRVYDRQLGLYKGAKVNATSDDWSIDLGSEYMTASYSAETAYVYWNSFENGFHGGAVDGPDHPEPGVPWWKIHGEWYKPAAPGPSISEGIYDQDPEGYITEQKNEYRDEAKKKIEPYVNEFVQALIDFIKGVS